MESQPLTTIVASRSGMHFTGYIYHRSEFHCLYNLVHKYGRRTCIAIFYSFPTRAKKAHVVSKRLDDFRERKQPQLGKVHDPIAETLNVNEHHTFGIMVKADEYSE